MRGAHGCRSQAGDGDEGLVQAGEALDAGDEVVAGGLDGVDLAVEEGDLLAKQRLDGLAAGGREPVLGLGALTDQAAMAGEVGQFGP